VVRIDPPHGEELLRGATALEEALGEACVGKLRRRGA
jgi:hypothetical protein